MAFLRKLLYCGLIFITATAFSVGENTNKSSIEFDYYLDDVPMHYNINLISFSEADKIKNNTVIKLNTTIDIFQPTIKISLNSSDSIYYVFGKLIENNANHTTYLVDHIDYKNETQILDLYFKVEVSRGNYILNIICINKVNITEDSVIFLETMYIQKFKNKRYPRWSETTNFRTIDVQRFFPFWDKLTIRATFNISIKHDRNYQVFSNMPTRQEEILESENTKTNLQWTHFDSTPAMYTHLVMVMLSPFSLHNSSTNGIHMWYRLYCAEHIKFAQRIALKVMMKLKFEWFKKLEVPELQLVAVPNLENYINMNFGLVIIREANIIYDENLHSIAQKIDVARLIARGVAHQWFGNVINPLSSHLWLNKGLTTLFGMDALDTVNALEHYENSEMLNLFIVQQYDSLHSYEWVLQESLSEVSSPSVITSIISFSHYIKAPLILRMIQHLITKKVFWKGINQYLHMHALNLTSPDDFWTIMQVAINESYFEPIKHTIPLKMLINWTKYTYRYCPVLKVLRNYATNSMNITIKNYNLIKQYIFWMPLTFTTESTLNFMNLKSPFHDERLILIQANKQFKQVDIMQDGWIMFNLQQAGHYRVNYDPENWRRIADYLNSGQYTKIHVLNRAKIIDDAFYFLLKHELDTSTFWLLTRYLAQETSYIAWYPMIKVIEYMSTIFPFPDEKVELIKDKLNIMLDGLLSKIKYEETLEEEDFTKCLRQEAIKWACILDNSDCQRRANRKLLNRIEKLETDKLLPWWEEWIYCKGLMLADSQTWHTIKNMTLVQTNKTRFLKFLTCTQSNHIIDKYLNLITSHNGTCIEIPVKDCVNSFLYIIAKHSKNNNVFKKILTNFDKLKPRDINELAVLIIIINNVYSEDQFKKIRNISKDIIREEALKYVLKINEDKKNIFGMYKTLSEQWIRNVEAKLEIRLSEIENKYIGYIKTLY